MTPSPLVLAARSLLLVGALLVPAIIQAQIPGGSSAREIPTEVQKTDVRVDQIIERANAHFKQGKLNLEDNKREQARDEFDKAIDEILMSGLDVRASQRRMSCTVRPAGGRLHRGPPDHRLRVAVVALELEAPFPGRTQIRNRLLARCWPAGPSSPPTPQG